MPRDDFYLFSLDPYLDLTLGFLVNPADACCSEFCDRSHWWQSKKWRVPKCRPKLIGLVAPTRVWTCLNIPWNAAHPSGQGPALCFWSSHARRQGKLCLNSTLRPTGSLDALAAWRDLSSHSKSIELDEPFAKYLGPAGRRRREEALCRDYWCACLFCIQWHLQRRAPFIHNTS